jgi:hypothetical protein
MLSKQVLIGIVDFWLHMENKFPFKYFPRIFFYDLYILMFVSW